jgi:hypothetical protein
VIIGLELSNLEVEVLRPKVVLRAKGDRKGVPTQGVGRLSKDDAEEGLIARHQPLEVEVHLLQRLDKDNVDSTPSIDEDLGKQGSSAIGSTMSG